MLPLEGKTVFHKLWYFLRTYVLVLKRFDLFLQGTLLVVLLLETNVLLLLRRDAGTGRLSALIEDWVSMGSAGAEFILGALVAWWGGGRRHLALSAWLALTAAASLLVLAFPFTQTSPPAVELCGGDTISAYNDVTTSSTPRTVFLVLTSVLCALTRVSIWAHGLTYLDDHEPHNGPYFYGILISIRLSLGLSGESWLQPGALREDWWEAHLSLAMLTLMFAVLFTLFPKKMVQWRKIPDDVDTGFFTTVGRVLRNRVVVVQTIAISLLSVALFGFVRYEGAYVQARFHVESVRQDPRASRMVSDIFRSLVVIFFVMIFRVRFSSGRADGVKASTASRVGGVLAVFVAVFFAVLAGLQCETRAIEGAEGGLQCSQHCQCSSVRYGFSPVCVLDSDVTYFSPCSAGCAHYDDFKGFLVFRNCSCGETSQAAIRGSCTLPYCRTVFSFYQIFFTVVVALTAAALLMQGMVILRAVRRCDKTTAVGASLSGVALLTQGLGRLLYMVISYLTCNLEGVEGASCALHLDTVWSMPVTSVLLALCSALVSVGAGKMHADGAQGAVGADQLR